MRQRVANEVANSFQQIVDALKVQLDADSPGNDIQFVVGQLKQNQHAAPNRVVWVNPGGTVGPVDGLGPGFYVVAGETVASNAILTDAYDVVATIWGQNEETAERIRRYVVRAAYRLLTNRSFSAARWVNLTQQPDVAANMNLGAKYRVDFTFNLPILDVEEQETALITDDLTDGVYVDVIDPETVFTESTE